jgi:hypothetical protein
LEVGEYEIQNKRAIKKHAWGLQIYNTYLKVGGQLEINVTQKARKDALEQLDAKENINNCFSCAKTEVLNMLQESYKDFVRSCTYEQMLTDLEGTLLECFFTLLLLYFDSRVEMLSRSTSYKRTELRCS